MSKRRITKTIKTWTQPLFKGLLGIFPLAGPLTVELINTAINERKKREFQSFLDDYLAKMGELEERSLLDVEYIGDNEYIWLFEVCVRNAMSEYRQEKINAYKMLLLNMAKKERISIDKAELFTYLIEKLATYHIIALKVLSKKETITTLTTSDTTVNPEKLLVDKLSFTESESSSFCSVLYQYGLLKNRFLGGGYLGRWTDRELAMEWEKNNKQPTQLGLDFIGYISQH